MNELDLLREVRGDVHEPQPEHLATARQRLVVAARSDELRRAGRRRSRTRRALMTGIAAAVLAGSVVLAVDPIDPAPATAQTLLRDAADATEDRVATGSGQFLAVTQQQRSLAYVTDGPEPGAFRVTNESTTYVPHDPTATWARLTSPEQQGEVFGGYVVRREAAREAAAGDTTPEYEYSSGGSFTNGELGGGSPGLSLAEADLLPREPAELLQALRADGDGSPVAVLQTAGLLLATGALDEELARAVFEALLLLPEVHVVDRSVDLDGRTGTAVGASDGAYTTSLVIDPTSGRYLGSRQVQERRVGAVPAGTVSYETSVHTTVVNQIPSLD